MPVEGLGEHATGEQADRSTGCSSCMAGKATLTTVTSRTIINIPCTARTVRSSAICFVCSYPYLEAAAFASTSRSKNLAESSGFDFEQIRDV